jgi:hypothetical protein
MKMQDYTHHDFQHDDHTDHHSSNYIMGCKHHHRQQLHDHHRTCSKQSFYPLQTQAKTNKTQKATRYVTVTPNPVVTTKTISLTRTLKTWTRTAVVYTRTATASCTVPPRPQQPDPPCTRWPRLVQIPAGVHIARDAAPESYVSIKKRLADIRARRAVAIDQRDLAKRSADAPTVTVTGTVTANQTVSPPSHSNLEAEKLTTKTRIPSPPPQQP